jgi:formyl-CoA transferase
MITLQTLSIQAFLHTKFQPTFEGGRAHSPTFAWYECSDGEWLTIGILDPKHWPLLCEALERQDLIDDERSADPFARNANREWLMDEIRGSIATKPRQHWLDAIVARDIPCGPVYDYAGMAADQQFWDNGYLAEVEHPNFPGHQAVGIPVAMNETPPAVQGIAPELGQNTEEILLALGYEWSDLERFHDEGVTAAK